MAVTTSDPICVRDTLEEFGIPYVHLGGTEEPGQENTYLTLIKISEVIQDKIKRAKLTSGCAIHDDINDDTILGIVGKNTVPNDVVFYLP